MNKHEILKYKNKFGGKRIWLLANGPSLNDIPLNVLTLNREYIFCLNRGYLKLFNGELSYIDFLAVVNPHVENQFRSDFYNLNKKF